MIKRSPPLGFAVSPLKEGGGRQRDKRLKKTAPKTAPQILVIAQASVRLRRAEQRLYMHIPIRNKKRPLAPPLQGDVVKRQGVIFPSAQSAVQTVFPLIPPSSVVVQATTADRFAHPPQKQKGAAAPSESLCTSLSDQNASADADPRIAGQSREASLSEMSAQPSQKYKVASPPSRKGFGENREVPVFPNDNHWPVARPDRFS